ncbi:hypothetical protein A2448_01730 [Candidatus Peregrinibacteria bacterium RIFOXYC2_FULL_41_22]|nr:MAG: hypothetical protein A2448_01730 [Candidatus Peregrinibacteria bacterium RIFOXYC2_FULL_41_22]
MKSKFAIVVLSIIFIGMAVYIIKDRNPTPIVDTEIETTELLYLTTMTHLEEGWDTAASNEFYFNSIAEKLRYGMDIAEQYDAILTLESALPFAQGCVNFDDNVLMEAVERGHGVGTHVDLAAKKEMPMAEAVSYTSERKEAVDNLVGSENNLGCSGVGGKTDWYSVAKGAGCSYMDGTVAAHYLAMSLDNRPEGWTDETIISDFFHYPAPVGDSRFYPFWIDSSEDFVEDSDGDILLSSGETFDISRWEEIGGRNNTPVDCGEDDCPFTNADIEALVDDITEFADDRDTSRITKYNLYIPARLFVSENEEVLELLFSEMQKLQDTGVLEWASQKSVYEAMVEERK